jgi:hypothetical protein
VPLLKLSLAFAPQVVVEMYDCMVLLTGQVWWTQPAHRAGWLLIMMNPAAVTVLCCGFHSFAARGICLNPSGFFRSAAVYWQAELQLGLLKPKTECHFKPRRGEASNAIVGQG